MATFYNSNVKNIDTADVLAFTSSSDSTIILSILVANTDGVASADVSVTRKDSGDVDIGKLAYTVVVPADSNVDILGNKFILPSGEKLYISSSTSGALDAHFSYVEV